MMYWLLLIGVPLLLGLYAQFKVSSAYQKNAQVASRGRITGREAAEAVMASAGIRDVDIVEVEGMLTDHYDPINKRLALSAHNYRGDSLAALGVAAHEAGHAIQHKEGYAMMKVRQTVAPAVQFAAPISYFIFGWGMFFSGAFIKALLPIAIAALLVMVLFQLVTLPVEFDASRRAKAQLVGLGILGRDEMVGVEETLGAAALTYVAAFVDSLGKLLYLLLLFTGGRRDD
ncbi:MAG: zinc metallopeptidase [Opitutaceae bacterium]